MSTLAALFEHNRWANERLLEACRDLTAEQLETSVERDPGEWIPASVILVQAIDHGREHRTHAATILTQLGIEPPVIDGWQFGGFE